MSLEIGHRIADTADRLERDGHPHYAAQLREKACSISSILAGGSSMPTKLGFSEFVGKARCATLEIANLVIFFSERELVLEKEESELVNMLKRESKMLENFRQSLERAERPAVETAEALI